MRHAHRPLIVSRAAAGSAILAAVLLGWLDVAAQIPVSQGAFNAMNNALQEAQRAAEQQRREQSEALDNQQQRFTREEDWLRKDSGALKDLLFLPPLPPALADSRPNFAAPPYPDALADYAGETFFMAYGQLRFRGLLKRAHVTRIERYMAARDTLVAALRARLAAVATLPPDSRLQALADFATTQQPALQKLENEAEAIRADLADLDTGASLVKQRDSEAALKAPGFRDYLSALFAAQFAGGLSVEQRQLLHEIALESVLNQPDGQSATVFFLPSPARVRWPEMPADIAAKRENFDRLHRTLKEALVSQVVHNQDAPLAPARRAAQYAAFAAQQTPHFEELHRLAEEIRVALAGLPYPDRPAPSDFPPELIGQVGRAVTGRKLFQVTYSRLLKDLSREFPPARFKITYEGNNPNIIIQTPSTPDAAAKAPDPALLRKLAECKARLERDHASVSAEMQAARTAVQRYRETLGGDKAPEISLLSANLARAHEREENWRHFADYYHAAVVPGLSPAQRRLLFSAAQRDLEKHRLQAAD